MHTIGQLDQTAIINDVTAQYPRTITVFNDFGVEICCGGDIPIAEAAERDGVALAELMSALRNAIGAVSSPG